MKYNIAGETFGLFGFWRRWLQAKFLRNEKWICALAPLYSPYEDNLHDYYDTEAGQPDHFTWLICERCGKKFSI